MTQVSIQDALISKLYNGVIEIANYTCATLNKKTDIVQLAKNDPSFDEIKKVCSELKNKLKKYKEVNSSFKKAEQVVDILDEIINAILVGDNCVLIDCTCHLEQFLEMNVRIAEENECLI